MACAPRPSSRNAIKTKSIARVEKEAPVSIGAFFAVVLVNSLKINNIHAAAPSLGASSLLGTVHA
jgi:hypothetical protein